jgi:hypothetical protein
MQSAHPLVFAAVLVLGGSSANAGEDALADQLLAWNKATLSSAY